MRRESGYLKPAIAAAATALTLACVAPAHAIVINWDHAFELQSQGGFVNPGVLVGFNPQPDPPGNLLTTINFNPPPVPDTPPDPIFVLHNQHLDAGPAPVYDFFITMALPAVQLNFVPDPVPADNFSRHHIEVDGRSASSTDINPVVTRLFDIFLTFASSSGGIVDAGSAVGFNPQPDPPGIFTPNGWGLEFSYTGNSDVSVALQILDAQGNHLALSLVPVPGALALMGLGLAALGFSRRAQRAPKSWRAQPWIPAR